MSALGSVALSRDASGAPWAAEGSECTQKMDTKASILAQDLPIYASHLASESASYKNGRRLFRTAVFSAVLIWLGVRYFNAALPLIQATNSVRILSSRLTVLIQYREEIGWARYTVFRPQLEHEMSRRC
ncbi:hypothetical protein DFH08DRAFT_975459 [Mycena albidolilacea]|uniref:Uncharacterized protein n=1 Tax=Mycena albidolilacea TaxID=1033008 RepID=A0AAD6Z5K7_9AGAR|nr:hypothetical protein DFH08DRAFT_975459 [Mycena albidolilacea]